MKNISHAYIFLGSKEETSLHALSLAQAVNCEKADFAPCLSCSACKQIQRGIHPDVVQMFPDGSSIKIDQIRKAILDLTEKPIEGKAKVYIFHNADTITREAQNALLKTLEEPASDSVIILLANNLKQLIPTVISRCQIEDFSKNDYSAKISDENRQKIVEILGSVIEKPKDINIFLKAKELADIDEKIDEVLELIISFLRDMLIIKADADALLINDDLRQIIEKYALMSYEKSIITGIETALKQLKAAKYKGNKNLICYNLLMSLEEGF